MVVVAVRAAIVRVVTAAVMPERARRVVPQESSLLRCKFLKSPYSRDYFAYIFLAVVVSDVDAVPQLLKLWLTSAHCIGYGSICFHTKGWAEQ